MIGRVSLGGNRSVHFLSAEFLDPLALVRMHTNGTCDEDVYAVLLMAGATIRTPVATPPVKPLQQESTEALKTLRCKCMQRQRTVKRCACSGDIRN
ncbi:hypothetical protein R8510_03066 [Ralstonia chuxiongensis]|nr:hypothetical protein R8510_03066 [Ralstonia chuxiongensis]